MTAQFPHMMPEEIPVWENWLAAHDLTDSSIDYDVKVGTEIQDIEDMPEPYKSNCIMLSKKRIDAVITSPDRITIVEVKKCAGWSAIGQALGYTYLFQTEYNPDLPVTPLIVTETLTPDVQAILDHYQIPYEIATPALQQ